MSQVNYICSHSRLHKEFLLSTIIDDNSQIRTNEGQCGDVAETYLDCSYSIDGDYMFGVTVGILIQFKFPYE